MAYLPFVSRTRGHLEWLTQTASIGMSEIGTLTPDPPLRRFRRLGQGAASLGAGLIFLLLSALCGTASAAMVTNTLSVGSPPPISMQDLTINVGDTVVWFNPLGAIDLYTYGWEWQSAPVAGSNTFAVTFTNTGFYAYYTTGDRPDLSAGTVTVKGWTNAPPAVTLNSPSEGHVFTPFVDFPLLATVANPESITMIQYFANTNLIGTVTNPPLGTLLWYVPGGMPAGAYDLVAKATDRKGNVISSAPVRVWVRVSFEAILLWGARVLPTGQVLFFFSGPIHDELEYSDSPTFTNYTSLGRTGAYGMYLDQDAAVSGRISRFYRIIYSP